MEKRMKVAGVLMIVAVVLMLVQCGCGSKEMARTGFLTDYSRLRAVSDTSLRYWNKAAMDGYSGFIVDRVDVHFHSGAKGIEEKSKGELTEQDLADLTSYLHSAIVKAISNAGKKVVYHPATGVARIRVALTDIEKTDAVSVLPQASLAGVGLGGVSMEAEIVDSMTGKQIAAVVEAQKGSRVPFSNLGEWTTAKNIMDDLVKRFQKNLQ
ncbi:MAG: DUF3313 domain-containing protein [Planctomycetota bacterium]|jgi:hypothetical protein